MSETKTHWKKVFNSDYLGSCDLEDGNDIKATIKTVSVKLVKGQDGKNTECNVAEFKEPIKPMILNVTNCKIVTKFAGSKYIEEWKDLPIQIYIDNNVRMGKEITEGLRIRDMQPTMILTELTPRLPVWNKVITHLRGSGTMADVRKKYSLSEANEQLLKEAIL